MLGILTPQFSKPISTRSMSSWCIILIRETVVKQEVLITGWGGSILHKCKDQWNPQKPPNSSRLKSSVSIVEQESFQMHTAS